jgi:hypothetical protein
MQKMNANARRNQKNAEDNRKLYVQSPHRESFPKIGVKERCAGPSMHQAQPARKSGRGVILQCISRVRPVNETPGR